MKKNFFVVLASFLSTSCSYVYHVNFESKRFFDNEKIFMFSKTEHEMTNFENECYLWPKEYDEPEPNQECYSLNFIKNHILNKEQERRELENTYFSKNISSFDKSGKRIEIAKKSSEKEFVFIEIRRKEKEIVMNQQICEKDEEKKTTLCFTDEYNENSNNSRNDNNGKDNENGKNGKNDKDGVNDGIGPDNGSIGANTDSIGPDMSSVGPR